MDETEEELLSVIEEIKACPDKPEELLLSLGNIFDFSTRSKRGIVANSIYNYINEVENNI